MNNGYQEEIPDSDEEEKKNPSEQDNRSNNSWNDEDIPELAGKSSSNAAKKSSNK